MGSNWPLHQDDYYKADECAVGITGKRKSDEVVDWSDEEPDSVGVSGGRMTVSIMNVRESFELHVWGYRLDVLVDCEEKVDVPVFVHSTRRESTDKVPKEDSPREVKEKFERGEELPKKIREKYLVECEGVEEGTRRVDIEVIGGSVDLREDATDNLWHGGSHSQVR